MRKTFLGKGTIVVTFVLFMVANVSNVFAQSYTDWTRCEGTVGNISSSLQRKLDLLGQQTGIKPVIRWGFRTPDDRALIIARSYSDPSLYRERDDGAIIRRSNGAVMVAAYGRSNHERNPATAVDLWNYNDYTDAQFRDAGLSRPLIPDEYWHIE